MKRGRDIGENNEREKESGRERRGEEGRGD